MALVEISPARALRTLSRLKLECSSRGVEAYASFFGTTDAETEQKAVREIFGDGISLVNHILSGSTNAFSTLIDLASVWTRSSSEYTRESQERLEKYLMDRDLPMDSDKITRVRIEELKSCATA